MKRTVKAGSLKKYDAVSGGRQARRPWQLLMVGEGIEHIAPGTREALASILDLLPELPTLILHTQHGSIHVSRDFAGDHIRQIDKTIAGIFRKDATIGAIEFPNHTATRDNPHILSGGKSLQEIVSKTKTGEISRDLMRDLLSTLFTRKQDDHE